MHALITKCVAIQFAWSIKWTCMHALQAQTEPHC